MMRDNVTNSYLKTLPGPLNNKHRSQQGSSTLLHTGKTWVNFAVLLACHCHDQQRRKTQTSNRVGICFEECTRSSRVVPASGVDVLVERAQGHESSV